MRRSLLPIIVLLFAATAAVHAQQPSLEYRVKAAYLYNFVKFVEWPAASASGPLTICVTGRNPFGSALAETVQGESLGNRPLAVRSVAQPDANCQVAFIPEGTAAAPALRAARGIPVLTVGETPSFLSQGGIINFVVEEGKVRFDINQEAAMRADLKISSRLLRLARSTTEARGAD
jgi:hypothetical protein